MTLFLFRICFGTFLSHGNKDDSNVRLENNASASGHAQTRNTASVFRESLLEEKEPNHDESSRK
jgi:hypothetical protein